MFVEMPSGSMMANGGVSCWPSIELLLVPGIPLAYWWSNGSPPQLSCLWKCLGRQNSPLNDLDVAGDLPLAANHLKEDGAMEQRGSGGQHGAACWRGCIWAHHDDCGGRADC